jgi:hypothetical protein
MMIGGGEQDARFELSIPFQMAMIRLTGRHLVEPAQAKRATLSQAGQPNTAVSARMRPPAATPYWHVNTLRSDQPCTLRRGRMGVFKYVRLTVCFFSNERKR